MNQCNVNKRSKKMVDVVLKKNVCRKLEYNNHDDQHLIEEKQIKYLSILKRNAKISTLDNISRLPKLNHVKPPKQNDVKNLMKFFNVPDDAKEFYHDIFQPNELPNEGNEDTDENDIPLYDEMAIF